MSEHNSNVIFQQRRKKLVEKIRSQFPDKSDGIILLIAGFEDDKHIFRQESSFFYLMGIIEPGTVAVIDIKNDRTVLYIPHFGTRRLQWVADALQPTAEHAKLLGVDQILELGALCEGYQTHPFFNRDEYQNLISDLQKVLDASRTIFTLFPHRGSAYGQQRQVLERLSGMIDAFAHALVDISPLVAALRRIKSQEEIESLYNAVMITGQALDQVAAQLQPGMVEYEIQGLLEYVFTSSGASIAFPSIVAAGKNATILHYTSNDSIIEKNDCVVVDIGAEVDYYCADLTRTFPVSGKFTARQRELYNIVLETQAYIAQLAKPGMWLSNKEHPEQSLHHLAQAFLKKEGYDQYFVHGIGHYLGIDVHDVGDYTKPLATGDVITIEPGLYIKDESIGIRIEDNYWIVEDGVVCLSEDVPRTADEIEEWMQVGSQLHTDLDDEDETDPFGQFDDEVSA